MIGSVKVTSWVDLNPLTESNCVSEKKGGEQLEVNNQSVG